MTQGKRILVTNDDGIDSPGIQLLERVARTISDDVWVVAPDGESSGAGHAISVTNPIRVTKRDERHWAVRGTPTDCALLGVFEMIEDGRKPDLLLSGVNRGPNLGEHVTYSGTCSAAMEGAVLNIPSIAFSLVIRYGGEVHWDTAERHAPLVLEKLARWDWKHGELINVNFPDCPPDEVTGIRVTRLGLRPDSSFRPVERIDERHRAYWWVKISALEGGEEPGNDFQAVLDNEVSVTPMHLDMTNHAAIGALEKLF